MKDPISRRRFLGQAAAATALIHSPSLPEIISKQLGIGSANALPIPTPGPFISLFAQGGAQMNFMVSPINQSIQAWINALDGTLMGLGGPGTNRVLEQRFGANGPFFVRTVGGIGSSFFNELFQYVTPDIESATRFISALVSVPDDSRNMAIDPTGLVRLAHMESNLRGSLFAQGVGNISGLSGTSQNYTHSSIQLRPTLVGDFGAIAATAGAPDLIAQASADTRAKFFSTMANLSTSQMRRFLSLPMAEQVSLFFGGVWNQAGQSVASGGGAMVDPRMDSQLVQSFASIERPISSLPLNDPRLFVTAIARLTALGLAGPSAITLPENYDYHFGSSAAENNATNASLAAYIGTILRVWHRHGVQNGAIAVVTDGGTASTGAIGQYVSDRSVASQAWLIVLNSSGAISLSRSYLGHYNAFQAAETSGPLAWTQDTAAIGSALYANYAQINGLITLPQSRSLVISSLGGSAALNSVLVTS